MKQAVLSKTTETETEDTKGQTQHKLKQNSLTICCGPKHVHSYLHVCISYALSIESIPYDLRASTQRRMRISEAWQGSAAYGAHTEAHAHAQHIVALRTHT